MRIGELAKRTGVSVRALRYYEEQRLLPSDRSPGGQRHYPEQAVERVRMIQQLYGAGLSSGTILYLLPCLSAGRTSPPMLDRLVTERDRIDRQIDDLKGARDRLDGLITEATEDWPEWDERRPA
ncbi:MerR family transcriptional regulator [Streptomyces hebeiensis]